MAVTVVIPTYRRSLSLDKVLPSYYRQANVEELIIVNDGADSETESIIRKHRVLAGNVNIKCIPKKKRIGALRCRREGVEHASNDKILFGEDDVILGGGYSKVLEEILISNKSFSCVSGRIIYLQEGEGPATAKCTFEKALKNIPYMNYADCTFNKLCSYPNDYFIPFTHAVYMTRRALISKIGLDSSYSKGNGYREESDFQIQSVGDGYKIFVERSVYCYHFSQREVPDGGQRTNRWKQFYWRVHHTFYFYDKNYQILRIDRNFPPNIVRAKFNFFMAQILDLFILPLIKSRLSRKR